jgi:Do/DeqQ family serine protease
MEQNNVANGRAARGRRGLRGRAAAAGAALLLTGSLVGWTAADNGTGAIVAAPATPPAAASARTIGGGVDSYAGLVDQVSPAVVTIRSERRVRNVSQQLPENHPFREFFGDRFGQRQMPERREGGLGSGVIVRSDGYILTNHHVVDGAEQVRVELTDGRGFEAEVVGSDPPSDLAVLKIQGTDLTTLALGNSDDVRVGDVVLAVGNPLGVGQTVTMGIVSAKGRATGAGDGSFEDFIQTDAPINRGNSGGALVSTRGELVGINSQILSPSGGSIGIGFAIPANMARNVMTQLIDSGTVRRGMLGVTIQPVTSDIARSLGLAQVRGALVNNVEPGSAAAAAGVRRGDVITAVNGEAVRDGNDLRNEIAQLLPGSQAALTVVRDGKEQTLTATLAELKAASRTGGSPGEPGDDSTGFGMSVEPLTPERAGQLGVQAKRGVVVGGVQRGSRAARAGLEAGDVIEEVDRSPVASVDALRSALANGDRPALLLVHRGATTLFLTLERK